MPCVTHGKDPVHPCGGGFQPLCAGFVKGYTVSDGVAVLKVHFFKTCGFKGLV